jgi:archaellum component FlaC
MPSKNKKPVNSESTIEIVEDTVLEEKVNMASLLSGLEDLLDSRVKLQWARINDLVLKFTDTTKSELESIRQNQEFLSTKFDELAASTNQLKYENMKCYLRRDLLEIM